MWLALRLASGLPCERGMAALARWRVVIGDDDESSRALVRAAVWQAHGDVAGEGDRCSEVLALVEQSKPDVAILAVGLRDGDGIEAAAAVTQAHCPVVLLTGHTEADVVARARVAGVMAFLLKPLRAGELAPVLDLAVARFRDAEELRRRLEERKVIERAKGILMVRHALTEEEAFSRLRRSAMDSRRTLADVARAVLSSALDGADSGVRAAQ